MRELVNIIGFRINETELASVEARVTSLAKMMSVAMSVPIVLFGKSILETGDKFQKLQLTVETFADSQEQANKVVEDLTKLALRLPTLSMEDLNDQAGKLIGQGVKLPELVDTLEMLSTIAGATGGNFQNLAKAYMDVQRAGKLQGQEVLQFKNANVPIWDLLTKSTGKSIEQLKSQKATFEEVKKALKDFGGVGSKAWEVMIKKGNLLSGVWLKLQDMFALFKIQLYQKMIMPLTTVLDVLYKIVNTLSGLDGNWKRFFVIGMAVAAIIPPLFLLKSLLTSYLKPLAIISGLITLISLAIDDIYVWVKGGDSFLGYFLGDYSKYEKDLQNFKQVLIDIATAVRDVGKAAGEITVALLRLFATIETKLGLISKMVNAVSIVTNQVSAILTIISALFSKDVSINAAGPAYLRQLKAMANIVYGEKGSKIYDEFIKSRGFSSEDELLKHIANNDSWENLRSAYSNYTDPTIPAYIRNMQNSASRIPAGGNQFGMLSNQQANKLKLGFALDSAIKIENLHIANTSGTTEELRKNIKLGFQDMFESVIRKTANSGYSDWTPAYAR